MLGAKTVLLMLIWIRNITAKSIEPLINEKTKAISIVHLAGWPSEMEKICNLAHTNNLKVIEVVLKHMVQK